MDITQSNWNESDTSNTTAAPDGAPEGMAPSGVNDVLRAHQGALKRWYNWTVPKVTGGTGTAYTLTYSAVPNGLADGMPHMVQFHAANGLGPTLNVNLLGAKPLHYYSVGAWRPIPPGAVDVDMLIGLFYHAGTGAYRLLWLPKAATGTVKAFAGTTPPAGYLLCAGQTLSRADYAGLFAAIGTTYGAPDSSTFKLPDLRSLVVAGRSDMGGSEVARFDGTVPRAALGGVFGSQYNTATTTVSGTASGSMAGTTDGPSPPFQLIVDGSGSGVATSGHSHNVNVTGTLSVSASGASSFSIVQPTMVMNQIIAI